MSFRLTGLSSALPLRQCRLSSRRSDRRRGLTTLPPVAAMRATLDGSSAKPRQLASQTSCRLTGDRSSTPPSTALAARRATSARRPPGPSRGIPAGERGHHRAARPQHLLGPIEERRLVGEQSLQTAAELDPAAVPLSLEVKLGGPRLADEYLHLLGRKPGVRECPLHRPDIDPGREVAGDRVRRLVNVSLLVRVGIDLRHDGISRYKAHCQRPRPRVDRAGSASSRGSSDFHAPSSESEGRQPIGRNPRDAVKDEPASGDRSRPILVTAPVPCPDRTGQLLPPSAGRIRVSPRRSAMPGRPGETFTGPAFTRRLSPRPRPTPIDSGRA